MTIRTKESTSGSNNVYHWESPCAYWLTVSIKRMNDLNREEVICDIQLSTRGVSQRESKQLSFLFAPMKYIWSSITRYLIGKTERHLWWYVLFTTFYFIWNYYCEFVIPWQNCHGIWTLCNVYKVLVFKRGEENRLLPFSHWTLSANTTLFPSMA